MKTTAGSETGWPKGYDFKPCFAWSRVAAWLPEGRATGRADLPGGIRVQVASFGNSPCTIASSSFFGQVNFKGAVHEDAWHRLDPVGRA
jgi:hypothetical protein